MIIKWSKKQLDGLIVDGYSIRLLLIHIFFLHNITSDQKHKFFHAIPLLDFNVAKADLSDLLILTVVW